MLLFKEQPIFIADDEYVDKGGVMQNNTAFLDEMLFLFYGNNTI